MKPSPIFIVGSSRSGTTLLQMMLNAHPNIAMYGEVHYFNEVRKLFRREKELSSDSAIDEFFSQRLFKAYHMSLLPKLDQVLEKTKGRLKKEGVNNSDFFRFLIESFADVESKPRCGEKTNENIRYIDELMEVFPDAKIIHIVRDARDVVASMINMPWASNDIVANALRWRAEISNVQRYKGKIHEIRYEDLLRDPVRVYQGICEFIGEPFSTEMMNYHKTSGEYIVNEPWKKGTERALNDSALQRWKRDLSDWQICAIQFMVGDLLRAYDYEIMSYGVVKRLSIPFVLCGEIAKYIVYKISQRKNRKKDEDGMIYGDDTHLYRLLLRSFLRP